MTTILAGCRITGVRSSCELPPRYECPLGLRKGPRGNPHVVAWFAPVPDHAIYLSVLVIGEIRRGIERIAAEIPARPPRSRTGLLR